MRMELKEFMTIAEASAYIGVSESYVMKRVRSGQFPSKRSGRKYLVDMHQLLLVLDEDFWLRKKHYSQ